MSRFSPESLHGVSRFRFVDLERMSEWKPDADLCDDPDCRWGDERVHWRKVEKNAGIFATRELVVITSLGRRIEPLASSGWFQPGSEAGLVYLVRLKDPAIICSTGYGASSSGEVKVTLQWAQSELRNNLDRNARRAIEKAVGRLLKVAEPGTGEEGG